METRDCIEKLIATGFKANVIASFMGVSDAYISMYRKGKRNLSKKNQMKLTEFLNKYKNIL
ncbi:hypothetical protein CPAST_c25780 [Clostridium pasteurianum DSM 525 = ATCC 6013]|uniref:Helix-turn-helix domain protein n=1 Tax=Clostridium pasteurianum DSM 525 = ATCC 6013 TaxID=1262449 RepID=A0A0H3J649_CLOPA|nr:hypothetical protein [Clostridium pasteurianum]AJA48647.1 hypothetical protein CPAST_c25780 [Clostridium pasteurianum DSM 525 = ATCC 6013]AJA52635.1 hypothetical protein CLPA_c25780 [Clostridium pasteurianum DSM 525 = ATCC 6013]AOZ75876.1 hypothetical protein AQ983_12530 [Clostridium pasteurianum DSM 525 = ATCC 6013]AOZ79672.1 hypothetical protein AQ984_12525 [Clostridium pasteurianum]ELP59946.1 hypothetical protein F502_04902 [Clostridium pasteurianum DSM 525 = ATCC 6013]